MSPVTSYRKWLLPLGWVAFIAAILVSSVLLFAVSRLPESSPVSGRVSQLKWLRPADVPVTDWSMFRSADQDSPAGTDDLQSRFILAGTFFEFTAMGSRSRQAILDDRVIQQQYIVREREKIDDIEILQILRDHVVLKDRNGKETTLWLNLVFGPAGEKPAVVLVDAVGGRPGSASEQDDVAGARRTSETSWVLNRQKLMEYYGGLRDRPERLVLLFDSLKPVYTPEGWITGYHLGVEGEGDFFKSVGLLDGDIVRSVNGVEMTNRRRAEYFFEQVVKNEANALVLAVQRGQVTNMFTYRFR